MITTELLSDTDPVAQPTLETAARLKIPFYKAGYYRYKFVDVRKELEAAGSTAERTCRSEPPSRDAPRISQPRGVHRRPGLGFCPLHRAARRGNRRVLLRRPSCGGRRRRRRVAHGVRPGVAAVVDDLTQGLLLGKERRLVAAAELPHGRRYGRLETVLRHARENAFPRSSVAPCGIRGHRHHTRSGAGEHVGRGRTRSGVRQGAPRRSLFRVPWIERRQVCARVGRTARRCDRLAETHRYPHRRSCSRLRRLRVPRAVQVRRPGRRPRHAAERSLPRHHAKRPDRLGLRVDDDGERVGVSIGHDVVRHDARGHEGAGVAHRAAGGRLPRDRASTRHRTCPRARVPEGRCGGFRRAQAHRTHPQAVHARRRQSVRRGAPRCVRKSSPPQRLRHLRPGSDDARRVTLSRS